MEENLDAVFNNLVKQRKKQLYSDKVETTETIVQTELTSPSHKTSISILENGENKIHHIKTTLTKV